MAETNIKKNKNGYGYKYTDLAQIHNYLEENNMQYYQYIEPINDKDYIMTVPIIEGKELSPRRGVQIVDAFLNGIKNPAQEQGSATTYARRYSLLMAFGLATEDDDAQSLTKQENNNIESIDPNKNLISETEGQALVKLIQDKQLDKNNKFLDIYKKYGYSKTNMIKQKDFMKIKNELEEII